MLQPITSTPGVLIRWIAGILFGATLVFVYYMTLLPTDITVHHHSEQSNNNNGQQRQVLLFCELLDAFSKFKLKFRFPSKTLRNI